MSRSRTRILIMAIISRPHLQPAHNSDECRSNGTDSGLVAVLIYI